MNDRETGWLLDDGHLCVGASYCGTGGFDLVSYTSLHAIRFAREIDAEMFRLALTGADYRIMARICHPIEHSWVTA